MTRRAGAAPVTASPARDLAAAEVSRILADALARDDARRRDDITDTTERTFERKVANFARQIGWAVVHFGGNQHKRAHYDATGFPDLLLIHRTGVILFRELKSARGKLSAAQQRWYERLTEYGANVAVWRPDDWPTVVTELTFGRGVAQ